MCGQHCIGETGQPLHFRVTCHHFDITHINMDVTLNLPAPVTVCIQVGMKLRSTLPWKLQENAEGTFVQLAWKPVSNLSNAEPCADDLRVKHESYKHKPRWKKSASKQRSQKRLEEFLRKKRQLDSPRNEADSVRVASDQSRFDEFPIGDHKSEETDLLSGESRGAQGVHAPPLIFSFPHV